MACALCGPELGIQITTCVQHAPVAGTNRNSLLIRLYEPAEHCPGGTSTQTDVYTCRRCRVQHKTGVHTASLSEPGSSAGGL